MTAKYVGNGTYIHGVPARDLTEAEYEKHKKNIKAAEKAAGVVLYEVDKKVSTEQTEGEGN